MKTHLVLISGFLFINACGSSPGVVAGSSLVGKDGTGFSKSTGPTGKATGSETVGSIEEKECPTVDVAGSNLNLTLSSSCSTVQSKTINVANDISKSTKIEQVPDNKKPETPEVPKNTPDDSNSGSNIASKTPVKVPETVKNILTIAVVPSSGMVPAGKPTETIETGEQPKLATDPKMPPMMLSPNAQVDNCESLAPSELDTEQIKPKTCVSAQHVED